MKNLKKRTASLLLAILSVASMAVSCSSENTGNNTSPENNTDTPTAAETTAAETEIPTIPESLPNVNYDGYVFRMLTTDEVGSVRYSFELDTEQMNGEVLNDAVYERNAAVEEKYGIELKQVHFAKSGFQQAFQNSVTAGDDSYDLFFHNIQACMKIGYLYALPVDELPYIDLSQKWWNRIFMESTALGGVNYGLSGDINLVDDNNTWILFFNKVLAAERDLGDMYSHVYDGTWTIDLLSKLCADVTEDVNGDGTLNYLDRWGMYASNNSAAAMLWAAGGMYGTLDDNGEIEMHIDSEHNINVLEKLHSLIADTSKVILAVRDIPDGINGVNSYTYSYTIFSERRTLISSGALVSLEYLRDMDDEFGYLPNPKYSEAQEKYYSTTQEKTATMFLVPKTAPDPERTSIILEAMASASSKIVIPAYYDVQLARKYSRDDESEAILDIIFENRVLDPVQAFNFGKVQTAIPGIMMNTTNTIASTIASLKTSAQADYDNTLKAILEAK